MLVTRQPALRHFWYPVIRMADLDDGPKPFRLLGVDLVLWRDGDGAPVALLDRCCHRTAKLSKGFCDGGAIVCGYHGWRFASDGALIAVPQNAADKRIAAAAAAVPAFRAAERYGYAWVALAEPLHDIPVFEDAGQPGFRMIDQFYEVWDCAGLRVMENSFDNAHFSFVHRDSFGVVEDPEPAALEIAETADGFVMTSAIPVKNPPLQMKNLKMDSDRTVRLKKAHWHMPFTRYMRITYPNGLVHGIMTAATPIDDRTSQIVQFAFRNDTEAEAPAADIIAFDRQVTAEDRYILESTEHDVPLDQWGGGEVSMASDRPGLLMRRMLRKLLADRGEAEATERPRDPLLAVS